MNQSLRSTQSGQCKKEKILKAPFGVSHITTTLKEPSEEPIVTVSKRAVL